MVVKTASISRLVAPIPYNDLCGTNSRVVEVCESKFEAFAGRDKYMAEL